MRSFIEILKDLKRTRVLQYKDVDLGLQDQWVLKCWSEKNYKPSWLNNSCGEIVERKARWANQTDTGF